MDVITNDSLPEGRGRPPMENAEVWVQGWEAEVDWVGGEDAVAVQQAAGHLGHVGQALVVLEEEHTTGVTGAQLLGDREGGDSGEKLQSSDVNHVKS